MKEAKRVEIIGVGYGGFCSECNVIHEPDPCPFSYTVGLTDRGWPELIVLAPKADVGVAPDVAWLLSQLAAIAEQRGRGFRDGDHVHGNELAIGHCVDFADAPDDILFRPGAAVARYGVGGFRLLVIGMYGLPYWLLGVPRDEIEAAIKGDAS